MNKLVVGVAVVAAAGLAGGCASTAHSLTAPSAPASSAPAAAPAAAPSPTPSPNGTFQFSCDTDTGATIYSEAKLTGEVDLTNTGNVGTIIRVRFAWKQEAYPSVVQTKVVRTRPGSHYVVRFHYNAGTFATDTAPLDRNLAWSENHGYRTACAAKASLVRPFGAVQSTP